MTHSGSSSSQSSVRASRLMLELDFVPHTVPFSFVPEDEALALMAMFSLMSSIADSEQVSPHLSTGRCSHGLTQIRSIDVDMTIVNQR